MITRIVRMSFVPEEAHRFPPAFNETAPKQKAIGCVSNVMYQEIGKPNVFITISVWESEAALEGYRHSDLFYGTWAKLKPYFNETPQAYSLSEVQ